MRTLITIIMIQEDAGMLHSFVHVLFIMFISMFPITILFFSYYFFSCINWKNTVTSLSEVEIIKKKKKKKRKHGPHFHLSTLRNRISRADLLNIRSIPVIVTKVTLLKNENVKINFNLEFLEFLFDWILRKNITFQEYV